MFPLRFFCLIKEALEWIIIKKMTQPKMDFSVFKTKNGTKRAEETGKLDGEYSEVDSEIRKL